MRVAAQKKIDGIWVGVLELQGLKVRLILKVAQDSAGALSAKLDVPDQGASDLPIDSISLQGQTLRFELKSNAVSYEGTLSSDGLEILGQFKQGPVTAPLIFKKADKLPTVERAQDPKKPYPYLEEEVSYENKADAVKLTGTLTIPRGTGPFPAVLLITGSGSQDRNETIAGHRPFLVLADHLTRLGIAVLRVDDRGMGGSSLGAATATSENYVGDVLTGVEFLKNRKEINARQIGLAGHSEGGMIAPMAAVKSKDIAFLVLMAGTGVPGDEVQLRNYRRIVPLAEIFRRLRAGEKLPENAAVVTIDDAGKQSEAATAVTRLINDHKAVAILGEVARLAEEEQADLHHVGAGRHVDEVVLLVRSERIRPSEVVQGAVDLLEIPGIAQ